MVATIKLYIDIGGSDNTPGSSIDTTALSPNLRFKTADDNTIDSNNPIPIPPSGTNYSFWKSLYLQCTVAPSTSVNNFRIYTDAAGFGTGITTYIGDEYPVRSNGVVTGYDVATGTPGDTGDEMLDVTNGHSELSAKTDLFSYTSGSPLTISDSAFILESGNIIDAINETTAYFILQVAVGSTATPGTKTAETITILYDEV